MSECAEEEYKRSLYISVIYSVIIIISGASLNSSVIEYFTCNRSFMLYLTIACEADSMS